ncbi:MAG: sulfur carrier protein ThiS [Pseudomonadota bacterium]|nr:sulfur carrier protein ThiS [Pseudomonadota bacterium]
MNIIVNGEPMQVAEDINAAELLDLLGLANKRLALEINRQIVPRSAYARQRLHDNDRIEIVHAIGGG